MKSNPDSIQAWKERSAKRAMEKARSKPRSTLNKIGKKGAAWNKARAEKNQEFLAAGITSCEIRLPGCTGNFALSHAHTRKRRNVVDLKRTVLSCIACHNAVESMGEKKMEEFLESIIAKRAHILAH